MDFNSSSFTVITRATSLCNNQLPDPLLLQTNLNTANMSDDEERVTMPFKFVTGECRTRFEIVNSTRAQN